MKADLLSRGVEHALLSSDMENLRRQELDAATCRLPSVICAGGALDDGY